MQAQSSKYGTGVSDFLSSDMSNILDDMESRATPEAMRTLVGSSQGLTQEIKERLEKFKEHSSVRIEDLITYEKLLDKKDNVNIEWNKIELFQKRFFKKINFLTEFIKEKEQLLQDQKFNAERARITQEELSQTIMDLLRELHSRFESFRH